MRAKPAGAGWRRFGLTMLFLVLGIGVVVARADDPAKPDKDKPADKADKPVEKPVLKKYSFVMEKKPWNQVAEWFSTTSGLTFSGTIIPTGSFNFIPPEGKKYTLPEIIDSINESLLANKPTEQYLLVRRKLSWQFVPADEPINKELVPSVKTAEFDQYGETEVVRLSVRLQAANADTLAPILKKTMSKFADAIAIEEVNEIILLDTIRSLKQVLDIMKSIDDPNNTSAGSLDFKCVYTRARDDERILAICSARNSRRPRNRCRPAASPAAAASPAVAAAAAAASAVGSPAVVVSPAVALLPIRTSPKRPFICPPMRT